MNDALLNGRLWTVRELVQEKQDITAGKGNYAWFFKTMPSNLIEFASMPSRDGGYHLLYIGKANNLRHRLSCHCRGPAKQSTFRRSLAALLAGELEIQSEILSTGKISIGEHGETAVSSWMAVNAAATWIANDAPAELEKHLIQSHRPPLNLTDNRGNAFGPELTQARRSLFKLAKQS